MRLPEHIRMLRRGVLALDAHATFTVLHAQIGPPEDDWRRVLLHAELAPAYAVDAWLRARFRTALGRWMQVQHRHVQQVYEVAEDDPPYALLEHAHGPTLADLRRELSRTGRPLPGHIADLMVAQLEQGRRALAAAEVAHGFSPAHVTVTHDGLQLSPRAWWDDRLTVAGDRRLLEVLAGDLLALTGERTRRAPDRHATFDEPWRFAVELCGEPELALEPA